MKNLKLKNPTELMNEINVLNSKLDIVKDKISELKDQKKYTKWIQRYKGIKYGKEYKRYMEAIE